MITKRVALFSGHYGSGKTNIAVNCALRLRAEGKRVTIADLDIVNPYFRTKDSEEILKKHGIGLVCSAYANTNLDIPALPKELYTMLARRDGAVVMDIGGDDRGAVALGRYAPMIREENDFDMFFVANFYRPLTRTPEDMIQIMREIEAASGLPFTAIVNNSNLAGDTTADTVLDTVEKTQILSGMTGLPVRATCVEAGLYDSLRDAVPDLFPMHLQEKYFDIVNGGNPDGKTDIQDRPV